MRRWVHNAILLLLSLGVAAPVRAISDAPAGSAGGTAPVGAPTASPDGTPGNAAAPAPDATSTPPTEATPDAGGEAASAGDPAKATPVPASDADPAAKPSTGDAAPGIWIWQGRDDTPVSVQSKRPRSRFLFDPQTDSGFSMRLRGSASLGYSSQTQTATPGYTDFTGGIALSATGFAYNPRLLGYDLWVSYDRSNLGFGDRDATRNGLSYGARFSLLQATPVPFNVSLMRGTQQSDGTLNPPFDFNSRATEINGSVRRLPVALTYRLGAGRSDSTSFAGYDLHNRYRSGDVAISRKWKGFGIQVGNDYLRSRTVTDRVDETLTINHLRGNVERSFGECVTTQVYADWSKYKNDAGQHALLTDSNVTSLGAELRWIVSGKLDTTFSAQFTRNAVNILQLLAPLSGITVLDTRARIFSASAAYRPWQRWTFAASGSHSSYQLPSSLAGGGPAAPPRLTNSLLVVSGSATYTRPLWKFDYSGGVSVSAQNHSLAFAGGRRGLGTGFGVTSAIQGGDDSRVHYGVRFAFNRMNNPVFFDLLHTNERALDVELSSRRFRFARLSARVEYKQREIEYAGSRQSQDGFDFLVAASRSNLDLSLGRTSSDANSMLFGVLSPVAPLVFSHSTTDTITASWRARHDLRVESRYVRFAFTLIGPGANQGAETWFDNSVQYTLGRFDIVGGYVHAAGHTTTSSRSSNRLYFKIKFPFQIW